MEDARAHVFAGLSKSQGKVTDGAQVGRHVAGGDHDIDDLDLVQCVGKEQTAPEILQRRVAALTGLQVDGLGALAVGGMVRAPAVQDHVPAGIAGSQVHDARGLGQRPLDQVPWQAGPGALIVHLAARPLQDLQGPARLVVDPDPFQ